MKRSIMFIALFLAAFMFPSIGSVDTADALGNYGCATANRQAHIVCLRSLLKDNAPAHLAAPSNDGIGNYGCSTPSRASHRDCLRSLLDQYAPHLALGNNAPQYNAGSAGVAPPPPGESGSNYTHLSQPAGEGGISGVEAESHSCAQFSGAPRVACEAAANVPQPVAGDISHCEQFAGPARVACVDAATYNAHP
jgi:hypothetical protein